MELREMIQKLSESPGVSGYEHEVAEIVESYFSKYCNEVKKDTLGNVIGFKKGSKNHGRKIMLAAHMDEIGLMVKDVDKNGFIQIVNVGGIDQRTLLCQEVIIHGKEKVYGVIGAKPPHLTSDEERSKVPDMEKLFIDTGFKREELREKVQIGDLITIKRKMTFLKNDWVSGKALDDRAGVATLLVCLKELQNVSHDIDVYCVATVQEEVGTRGAVTATYEINPDIGIAIDVGFGRTPELKEFDTIEVGKGPAITMGPNIHPGIFKTLKETAKKNYIDYQVEVEPGSSGTDAWPMQVTRSGVAAGLLSIPLRYMHTSVETLSLSDIEKTGKLLARFIIGLNDKDLEELLCY